MEWRRLIALFGLFFSACLPAQIYQWVDENGQTRFSDKAPLSTEQLEQESNPSSEEELKVSQRPSVVDLSGKYPEIESGSSSIVLSLKKLLRENRFVELNQRLASYNSAMESDISKEEPLFTAYNSFDNPEWAQEQLYHAWTNATPESYQAYLARAYYYFHRAWYERGTKWSSETPQESLGKMNKFLSKAQYDLDTALRLRGGLLPAYGLKIAIANTQGGDEAAKNALEEGLKFHPYSFRLRSNYVRSIAPRWGGSYEDMLSFAMNTEPYFNQNPRLKLLYGFVLSEAAGSASRAKVYTKAVELYSQAITYGDYHVFYSGRGESYYRSGQYDLAIADLDKAILQYSDAADYYYWRSRAYHQKQNYKKSLADAERASELDPIGNNIKSQLARLASVMSEKGLDSNVGRNLEKELSDLNKLIDRDPNNAASYYNRARFFVDRRKFDLAIDDLKVAIDLNPDNIGYYNLLDWCLLTKKDFDQIISYWDRYIYRHPAAASAYYERSGTYYHKGDQAASLRDLEKAAELGHPEALYRIEREKTL